MTKRDIEIKLSSGLEATPIALLVQKASQFDSKIYIEAEGGRKVNAKSIMGMMSLGVDAGDTVTVSAEGEDEEAAIGAITDYLMGNN